MPRRQFRTVRLFENLHPASGPRLPRERDTFELVWYHCYLDNVLEGLLRRAFIRNPAVSQLFENGPLWRFTTKIGVAFALGLLTDDDRADLLLVNSIRNHVAHNIRGSTFRGRRVQSWVSHHSLVKRERRARPASGPSLSDMSPRERFGVCVWVLGSALERRWSIRRLARPRGTGVRRRLMWPRLMRALV
jgi:hypothetical protein